MKTILALALVAVGVLVTAHAADTAPAHLEFAAGLMILMLGMALLPSEREVQAQVERYGRLTGGRRSTDFGRRVA